MSPARHLAAAVPLVLAALLLALVAIEPVAGQAFQLQPGQQKPTPEQIEAMKAQAQAAQGGQQPKPEGEKKEGDEKKADEKKEGEKKDEGPKDVERPTKPPRVPDPRELKVELDDKGRIPPFNFIGQPWPDVLQWFANLSKRSLDWQDLPGDYLNLTTQRAHTLDEARDLLNRHLHARGFTMLEGGEVLSVFKIEKLDPSLVPRVTEDELYDHKPYDFVKVSFELPEGMEVEKAKEDIKQVLSPQAKVMPLVTTKRLLVIDAVANLRLASALLNEERSYVDGHEKPTVFQLRYARADKVADAVYVLLGLDPQSRPTQMELQVEQQRLQIMMQMQQSGKDIGRMLQKDGPPVYLAVNRQNNSILVNAPRELMPTIAKAIKALDVPSPGSSTALTDDDESAGAAADFRIEKYPLVTLNADALVMTLEEIGNLDPRTQLRADAKAKVVYATAPEADHRTIQSLVDQLDGTGRQLEVVWLPRHLPADAVAGSLFALMSGQAEEEEEERPFWYYWDRGREEEKPKQGFRVDADIENNRLLMWANDAEMKTVRQFLDELSKAAPDVGGIRPVRVLQPLGDKTTERLLEQLRAAWPALGDNELIIDDKRKDESTDEQPPTQIMPPDDRSTRRTAPARFQFAQHITEEAVPESNTGERPPITITVTEDGRLVMASQDVAALDRLEEFVNQIVSPDQRFKVFRLKYATAFSVWQNLDEFYAEELRGNNEQILDWWGYKRDTGPKDKGLSLSKRRNLQIIWDTPSNSILVANASPSQLREIESLIKEYDQPADIDSTKTRRTEVIKIRYSRATKIAEAVKDVYRDLLSSRDKEFEQGDKKASSSRESTTIIRYGGGGDSDDSPKKTSPVKVGFEGALSIGVDEIGNMLIVSAQDELFDSVVAMIHRLDEAAKPDTTVEVHRVGSQISAEALQKALNNAVSTPWVGGRPEKEEPAEKKPEVQPGQQQTQNGEQQNND